MKYKRLAVLLENKSGSLYEVVLNQEQMDNIMDLVGQMCGGKIKIRHEKFPAEIGKIK